MERVEYAGWPTCYRLTNQHVELVVTGDVGLRIIHFSLRGGRNVFYVDPETAGRTGSAEWQLYGGHRLWHAPEDSTRTYVPDNTQVDVTATDHGLSVTQPVEESTGIQKQMVIDLAEDAAEVTVRHRLTNCGVWTVRLAPWALSVMDGGGVGILPLPRRGTHPKDLLPTATLVPWLYTDMADPRWEWGSEHILLRHEPGNSRPQKLGVAPGRPWAAYALEGVLFVSTFTIQYDATYPDRGSVAELFTNDVMMEVETLGPLTHLAPGETAEHVEHWHLFRGVPVPDSEAAVRAHILPLTDPLEARIAELA